jgi:alpha-tubulin suppressor-like RCC1 family protein
VSVGFSHGFALTESNEVYTWIMQARQDNIINKHKSLKVEGVPTNTNITDIKSGSFQTIMLTENGFVFKIDHPVPKEGFITNVLEAQLKAV